MGVPLRDGLEERGYAVGQDVIFECRRSEEASEERFRDVAAELAHLDVDVIVAISSTATRAVRSATSTISTVAIDLETDPVGSGLAASLARPGGNITGVFLDALEIKPAQGGCHRHHRGMLKFAPRSKRAARFPSSWP